MNYYSFWIGSEKSKRSEWMLLDMKIPAASVKEAIFIYFKGREYRRRTTDIFKSADDSAYYPPTLGFVVHEIQRAVEYKRKPSKLRTRHNYKKIRTYSRHTIRSMYKGYNVRDYI